MFDEKGQMHTMEGVAAATIMLLVIVYAIDATSMTPLTSSTANVHVETELQVLGQDILGALDYAEPGYNSNLTNDILRWNGKEYIWDGTNYMEKGNASYSQNNLTNNLTNNLKYTLIKQGIAHSVELTFLRNDGTFLVTQKMIYNGNPSDNAVIVSRKIAIHNSDNPNATNIQLTDIDPSTNLYNIVDVKLILWRM
ncbi:MAG: hypothetical protein OIN84_11460 [Candidatus Methanoperedens sp.]|uniref:DUF7288 family protein n=1 Tax=Candidatus Methanoperedens sp. BLZ2 TaxID=2035255 RepID=UPI0020D15151|nr:hypothetical protein [Candidatus Methanoperedens sp. BLZ2]MCX9078579.1 hypothetical protein [Candidatus Methanoperedens sp.]